MTYCVTITTENAYKDGAGGHDAISWGTDRFCKNGGNTYIQSNEGTYLASGMIITFAHMGGHTVGSMWAVTVSSGTAVTDWRGYPVTQINGKFAEAQSLTLTVQVATTGKPVFGYDSEMDNTCATPATIRPYFQSGALLSTNADGSNRWWSSPDYVVLANGIATIRVPLEPQYWSDTWGAFGNSSTTAENEFATAISNVNWIGVTLGGGCFYGHGVNVSGGTATISVTSYSVN